MSTSYLRTSELAQATGYRPEHLARMAARKEIPGVVPRRPGGSYRYERSSDLEKWIKQRRAKKGLSGWNALTNDELSAFGALESAIVRLRREDEPMLCWSHAKLKAYQAVLRQAVRLEGDVSATLRGRQRGAKRRREAAKRKAEKTTLKTAATPSTVVPRPPRSGGDSGLR